MHIVAGLPLLWLAYDIAAGNLSPNPIQDVTYRTGKPALALLVASLAVTPLVTLTGWRRLVPHRRTLGLWAFAYVSVHFFIFLVVDYGLDPVLLREAVLEKRYAFVGFAAFLILAVLTATSTKGAQRRLGRKWKQLHRLAYLAGLLAVVHYTWLVKSDVREPLAWGAAVLALLAMRLPAVRRAVTAWRRGSAGSPSTTGGRPGVRRGADTPVPGGD